MLVDRSGKQVAYSLHAVGFLELEDQRIGF